MATITLLAMIRYTRIVNSNDCQCIITYVCTNPMLLLPSMIYFSLYFLFRSKHSYYFIISRAFLPCVSRLLRAENTFTDRHLNMYAWSWCIGILARRGMFQNERKYKHAFVCMCCLIIDWVVDFVQICVGNTFITGTDRRRSVSRCSPDV